MKMLFIQCTFVLYIIYFSPLCIRPLPHNMTLPHRAFDNKHQVIHGRQEPQIRRHGHAVPPIPVMPHQLRAQHGVAMLRVPPGVKVARQRRGQPFRHGGARLERQADDAQHGHDIADDVVV